MEIYSGYGEIACRRHKQIDPCNDGLYLYITRGWRTEKARSGREKKLPILAVTEYVVRLQYNNWHDKWKFPALNSVERDTQTPF
jgi:hypothetical protein